MATLLFGDRVQDTSTTTGTGDLTLSGTPPTGYVTFDSIFGHGGTYNFYYCIQSSTLSDWEVGLGHLSAATTLVRDTILASSNAGSAVSFGAGTKTIFCTIPAIVLATTQPANDNSKNLATTEYVDTAVTVNLNTVQVLTNKDMSSGTNTWPTFNQNTTGSAAKLSISGQTGLLTFTGLASTNRIKTIRDAADTILELGGSYTPTGNWTSLTMITPVLGVPTSGTLTNCTGLPIAGLTASTSTALGVGSIELGAASDTTLSRSSAGVLAVEGVVIPSISSTNTLTNKWIQKRTGTTTSSATPTINTDNVDFYSLTAQTADITSFTTNLSGTPTEAQTLWVAITGTAVRAITWGTSFEASTVALPTTTVTTARLDVGFIWNTVTSKWRCVAVA